MERTEITHVLEKCEFFKGLAKSDIAKIADLCQVRTYEGGTCVFQQGDFGEHIYIVAEGRVLLERSIDMGSRKGSVTIDVIGKGKVLGCWSTLLNEPHILMSQAVCQKRSRLLVVKGSDLRMMMLGNKELGFKLMENLCFLLRERLRAAYGAMEKV